MASKPHNWTEPAQPVDTTDTLDPWVSGRVNRVWAVLEYSSAYLAFVAAVKVFIVTVLLSLPLSLAPLVGALVTFAVYANDRLVDLPEDRDYRPRRAAFVSRYRNVLYATAAVSYGIGVAVSALGGPLAFGLTLLPGVAWVLYAIEWLRIGTVGIQRLKEVPLVSSLLVAFAWSVPVVVLPVAFTEARLTPLAALVFVYFALTTLISTEMANIRDVESDRASGIRTVPTVFGVERTRTVLYAIGTLTLTVLGYGAYDGYLTGLTAAILAVGVFILVTVLALSSRLEDIQRLTVSAECSPIPVLALLAIAAMV